MPPRKFDFLEWLAFPFKKKKKGYLFIYLFITYECFSVCLLEFMPHVCRCPERPEEEL